MTRKVTNKLLEMVEDGVLDAKTAFRDALNYMSEADVADFADCNAYLEHEDDEEDHDPDEDVSDEDRAYGPDRG